MSSVVDAVTAAGIAALGLSSEAPIGASHEDCWPASREAYHGGRAGVGCRSAAEARVGSFVGEELAYFDSQAALTVLILRPFAQWYPDQIPVRTSK